MGQFLRMRSILLSTWLLLTLNAWADDYAISIDPTNPLIGSVTLTFDAPLSADENLLTRSPPTGTEIEAASCIGPKVDLIRMGSEWIAPRGCTAVTWSIQFIRVGHGTYPVMKQQNIYHPKGWWLFTEWDSILRREGQTTSSVCVSLGDLLREFSLSDFEQCRSLPRLDQAPLLFAFGKHDHALSVGGFSFRVYLGFGASLLDHRAALDTFGQQLKYLTEITSGFLPKREPNHPLDIVWLGIDSTLGQSTGAAGYQALAANFVVDVENQEVTPVEQFRLLWISAHEVLHLLGINRNAVWASESLPTYLAFRSFDKLAEQPMANKLFREMAQQAVGQIGLLEANRRVAKGEQRYLGAIYTKGAMFWRELDNGIRSSSGNTKRLTDFFPALFANEFEDNGGLPAEFIEAIRTQIPAFDIHAVLDEYL